MPKELGGVAGARMELYEIENVRVVGVLSSFFNYIHDLNSLRLDASIIPFPLSAHPVLHVCLDPQLSIILTNLNLYLSTVYAVQNE